MPDIIQLLPESIANQIAAGEVVQRPASVVKELLENSIDAGASEIQVIVKDAGKAQITVIDNGSGMSMTDVRLSIERHATSKLRTSKDLFNIRTMGFRGEAMASIAAVSQMEIKTRKEEDELGTVLEVHGSEVVNQEMGTCSKGTKITVKNLFYNIPARRNFLKSNSVEMRHIMDEFQRIALSHPDKSFSLFQNDLEAFKLTPGKLSHRIVSVFGKNYQKQLTPVSEDTEGLSLRGYIGKPELSKKTRGDQYFFVNGRYIKSNYLNHAVVGAYEGLLQADTYPFYLIFLDLPPERIDVNVHPTKTEIKFEDERMVYGIVKAAVRQALGAHNLAPSIDFNLDVNFGKERYIQRSKDQDYSQFKTINPGQRPSGEEIGSWNSLINRTLSQDEFQTENEDDSDIPPTGRENNGNEGSITYQSAANDPNQEFDDSQSFKARESLVFQLQNRYILTSVKSGLMMIDQNAAHQRILYERFSSVGKVGEVSTQRCLFPQTIDLSPADFKLFEDIAEEIRLIGFEIEHFGNNCVIVNGIPTDLGNVNEKDLIENMIEQYKHSSNSIELSKKEILVRSISKKSAIKPGKSLSKEEMISMIDRLFATKNPNYTPEGQVTFVILDLDKINTLFLNQ